MGWIDPSRGKSVVTYYAALREPKMLFRGESLSDGQNRSLYVILRNPGGVQELIQDPIVDSQHQVIDVKRAAQRESGLISLPEEIDYYMYAYALGFAKLVATAFRYSLDDRIKKGELPFS